MFTDADYKSIVASLNFQIETEVKKIYSNGVFLFFGQHKGTKCVLKIIAKSNTERVAQLKVESEVDKAFQKFNADHNDVIKYAEFLSLGENKTFVWSLRKFYEGQSLAVYDPRKSLIGYDLILPQYTSKLNEILPQVFKSIDAYSKIVPEDIAGHEKIFKSRYHEKLEEYDLKAIEDELSVNLNPQLAFYSGIASEYHDSSNICGSMGDMGPANILVDDNLEVRLIDFELFCFENPAMDIAYLWLYLWRYPEWQNCLLQNTLLNEQDKDFFRASIIRILCFLYNFPSKFIKDLSDPRLKDYNKKHIWRKYLINAGISYDELINTRK